MSLELELELESYTEILSKKINLVLMGEMHLRAYPTNQAGQYKKFLKSRLKSHPEMTRELKKQAIVSFAEEIDRMVDHYEDISNTQ